MEEIFDIFDEILIDEDEEAVNLVEMPRQPRVFRNRLDHFNIWNDQEFLNRFRLSKESVYTLHNQIVHLIQFPTRRNNAVSSLLQLLIALRFYACGSMLIVVGDFSGVHKSTVSCIIRRVTQSITTLLANYIQLPTTNEEIVAAKTEFYNIARFPKVLGAIDCTHVKIQSPGGEASEHFRNRKGFFSINVQTVSDAKLRIRNIVARWPGSQHDSTIFNNSRLKHDLETNYQDCFLLGDSGYPVKNYLMTPLLNPATREELLYNESLTRTRNVVERSYGVWKRRFPILSLGMRLKLETIQAIIVATAILHNIAINLARRKY